MVVPTGKTSASMPSVVNVIDYSPWYDKGGFKSSKYSRPRDPLGSIVDHNRFLRCINTIWYYTVGLTRYGIIPVKMQFGISVVHKKLPAKNWNGK